MRNLLLLLIIFSSVHACKRSSTATFFEMDGVSFISPEGWKITDKRNTRNSGYYVSCQRKDFGSNGIFMVSWINGVMELDKYIRMYMKEFEKNVLMKAASVQFEEPVDSVFIGMPCSMSIYHARILGVETRGEIYSFGCSGKTFILIFQQSVEESEKNKAGFDTIKNTFSCIAGKNLSDSPNPLQEIYDEYGHHPKSN